MTSEVQEWYAHLAQVIDELRQDIRSMNARDKKPRDFGMRVLSHPGMLLVTARNKMKSSKEVELRISFSKFMTETAYIAKSKESQKKNIKATLDFLDSLKAPNKLQKSRRIWTCNKEQIAAYLISLEISKMNSAFIPTSGQEEHPLIRYIRDSKSTKMQEWDVALPEGDGEEIDEIQVLDINKIRHPIKPRYRQFEVVPKSADYLKINRGRVGGIEDETIGLSDEIINEVKKEWDANQPDEKKKAVPGLAFRERRMKPLLTISLIVPKDPSPKESSKLNITSKKSPRPTMLKSEVGMGPFVAIGLSFPNLNDHSDGHDEEEKVIYRLNKVALLELGLIEEEDEDAID